VKAVLRRSVASLHQETVGELKGDYQDHEGSRTEMLIQSTCWQTGLSRGKEDIDHAASGVRGDEAVNACRQFQSVNYHYT
jgi:hypothetical protein